MQTRNKSYNKNNRVMKIQSKTNKHQDATAYYFNLGYDDIELYSITIVDAYRTPTAKIMIKWELDKFLNDW